MNGDGHIAIAPFRHLERTCAGIPEIQRLDDEVPNRLGALELEPDRLRGRRIAVAIGSRGVARIAEIARAACGWLKSQGADPFVFPAMGSHGGATAEGQREILRGYGVTADYVGVPVRSDMTAVSLGLTPEGFHAFMDRNAFESDGVLVINRVKPHTDFTGKIESGLLKMMAVGMGKIDGAQETHRWARKYGYEQVIRGMSAQALASGKILAGLAVIENELHQVCQLRAARPGDLIAMEESALATAKGIVPRLPFSRLDLLMIDELGKNISGTGMDTKVIGRGLPLQPGDGPDIGLIYVRDLSAESAGNALGIGLADVAHDRLHAKVDYAKMYVNARTSLNPPMARMPIHLRSDREALDFALGALGSPAPAEQRFVWIENTLNLGRIAVSNSLTQEASAFAEWQLTGEPFSVEFDSQGDIIPRNGT